MRSALLVCLGALSLGRFALSRQTDAAFEVATVRLSAPQQDSFDIETSAERLRMRNVTLRRAIQFAWGLHEYQMSGGPKWIDNDGYDIVGKPSEDLSALSFNDRVGRLRSMLRALLSERFQLVMRKQTKDVPAFALSIAKGGFTLKRIEPGGAKRGYGRPGELAALGSTIAEFVALLEAKFQRPVVNRTGIEGIYDFRVRFAPDNDTDSPLPSIFTAIQEQCGLKLETTTTPGEAFFIERVERPTEN